MKKTSLIVKGLTVSVLMFLGLFKVQPVLAVVPIVSIAQLPAYMNTNSFKLSCTALNGNTAQFSYRREGGGFVDFGSAINLNNTPCQVQVTGTQVNDQVTYYFRVTVDGVSEETSTFYDASGPSPVSNYYKDKISDSFYKLHWKNPGDADFARVILYRGETSDFSADNSHEIAQVLGSPNSDMTYDEHTPDPNKTFYYALRAIDRADNSSSLVGDVGTTYASPTPGAIAGTSSQSKVGVLPKEEGEEGEVLPSQTESPEATEAPKGVVAKAAEFAKNKTKITVGIIALIVGLPSLYFYFKKREK